MEHTFDAHLPGIVSRIAKNYEAEEIFFTKPGLTFPNRSVITAIIRSLRFGTSLGEVLEQSAEQARAARKAQVEERVAKAPVKMMIPTGTLILPAMLLLVLGPVLLELMEGI